MEEKYLGGKNWKQGKIYDYGWKRHKDQEKHLKFKNKKKYMIMEKKYGRKMKKNIWKKKQTRENNINLKIKILSVMIMEQNHKESQRIRMKSMRQSPDASAQQLLQPLIKSKHPFNISKM